MRVWTGGTEHARAAAAVMRVGVWVLLLQATHAKRACWEGVLVGFSGMRWALGVGFGLAGSARGRQCGEHLGFSASDGRIGRNGHVLRTEPKCMYMT